MIDIATLPDFAEAAIELAHLLLGHAIDFVQQGKLAIQGGVRVRFTGENEIALVL